MNKYLDIVTGRARAIKQKYDGLTPRNRWIVLGGGIGLPVALVLLGFHILPLLMAALVVAFLNFE